MIELLYQQEDERTLGIIALTGLILSSLLIFIPKSKKTYGVALVEVDKMKKIVPLRIALRMVHAGTGKILLSASDVSELQVKALRKGLL